MKAIYVIAVFIFFCTSCSKSQVPDSIGPDKKENVAFTHEKSELEVLQKEFDELRVDYRKKKDKVLKWNDQIKEKNKIIRKKNNELSERLDNLLKPPTAGDITIEKVGKLLLVSEKLVDTSCVKNYKFGHVNIGNIDTLKKYIVFLNGSLVCIESRIKDGEYKVDTLTKRIKRYDEIYKKYIEGETDSLPRGKINCDPLDYFYCRECINNREDVVRPKRGFDGRRNYSELECDCEKVYTDTLAKYIFGFINNDNVLDINDNGVYFVSNNSLKSTCNVCDVETFSDEPVNCKCTSFLVRDNIVVTAAHCVDLDNYKNELLVNNYGIVNSSKFNKTFISGQNIFKIDTVLLYDESFDIALLKLDKELPLKNIPLSTSKPVVNSVVYTIGHPLGLPMKFSFYNNIKSSPNKYSFIHDIDTYQGNSGSPVFDDNTNVVVGLVVKGRADFEKKGNCYVSKVYPKGTSREFAISSLVIIDALKAIGEY